MSSEHKQVVFNASDLSPEKSSELKKSNTFVDIYEVQCAEYLELVGVEHVTPKESYILLPLNNMFIRMVDKETYFTLRTNRNKNIITKDEQNILANKTIGVLGMSVGAAIAVGAVQAGLSNSIKIADFDTVSSTNLNRLRVPVWDVGKSKVLLAAEQIYSVDPYTNVDVFEGVTEHSIDAFIGKENALHALVDEIDDFKMKIVLRLKAREKQLPVIMMTSLGDNILVDVERFDLEPTQEIFHGLLGTLPEELIQKDEITDTDIKRLSVQIVGANYVPTRALESLPLMGKELNGRPQLSSTIAVDGGLAVYILREIFLDHDFPSGRYYIEFSKLFNLSVSDEDSKRRTSALEKLGL